MQRILIIEDDPDIRMMLKKMLEREKYEVAISSNGVEGLKIYNEASFDLVITDLVMPEKEGIETIAELKKINATVKIIAISGGGYGGLENYLQMAKAFGAHYAIAKPFEMSTLLAAVRDLFQQK